MRFLLFSLLLLIPLITTEETKTADLGFSCDEKKCVFSLAIPQSAVEFVDVQLLRSEIDGLNQNVTELKNNEKLIHDDEDLFNSNFTDLYIEAESMLSDMFDISFELNQTASELIDEAAGRMKEANDLNTALSCMVKAGDPEECGKNVSDLPTTVSPIEPTDDSTDKTPKPTELPFTRSTTTTEPFTGTTTTPEPFTGTTTTPEPYTGTTVTEEEKSTTEGPTQPSTTPGTEPTQGTEGSTTPWTEGTQATDKSTTLADGDASSTTEGDVSSSPATQSTISG
ncbi:hypothetical protein PENTCL1PPCAC_2167 [Pristionchus entomophagus]|uniref:Uncharacterized protein n=1 Tax=Pristionchus entomophagus TaxID=358040 RepID=A0AAV5S9U9_9BILA|nr:hypothetical protein PENTCL1PPCAC_2167 [Pristionchus entomophagus]